MSKCKHCNKEITKGYYCPSCYAYLRKHPEGWYDLPEYGEIKYASNGDVVCHECGGAFGKLGNHIAFKHHMNLMDYKDKHGLYHCSQLTSSSYKIKMQGYVKQYYNKAVLNNLLYRGLDTRYSVGKEVIGRGRHISK